MAEAEPPPESEASAASASAAKEEVAGAAQEDAAALAPKAAGAFTRARSRSRGKKRKQRRSPAAKLGPGRRRRDRERERDQRRGRDLGSEGPDSHGLVTAPVRREPRAKYQFGNYDQYYKQRFDRFAKVDPRIQGVLSKAGNIFADKVVLDIGCNTGFITFLVAALGARQAEGIDIDVTCISRALRYLRYLKEKGYKSLPEGAKDEAAQPEASGDTKDVKDAKDAKDAKDVKGAKEADADWHKSQFPASCVQSRGQIPYHAKPLEAGALQEALSKAKVLEKVVPVNTPVQRPPFPYNIEFRSANVMVTEVEEERHVQYDVVLLFRVTKWIHLNWEDKGIERLFLRCNNWLRLGGLLVLEVKDQDQYGKEKHTSKHTRTVRENLQIFPAEFNYLLTDVYGFQRVSSVNFVWAPGMKAPLQLYRKVARPQEAEAAAPPTQMGPPDLPTMIRRKPQTVPPRQRPLQGETPSTESDSASTQVAAAPEAAGAAAPGMEMRTPDLPGATTPRTPQTIPPRVFPGETQTTESDSTPAPAALEAPQADQAEVPSEEPEAKRPRTEGNESQG